MKQKFLCLILFFLFSFHFVWQSNGQDLITTSQGDSINCYITKVKPRYIHFLNKNAEGETFQSLISVDSVTYYALDFFEEPEINDEILAYEKSGTGVLITFDVAYSHRLGKVDASLPSGFAKQIKNGVSFSAQFGYLYSRTSGFGFQFNRHFSNADFSGTVLGSGTDKVKINFFDPAFYFQSKSEYSKTILISSFSIGYMGLDESLESSKSSDAVIKGSSLGIGYSGFLGGQVNDVIVLSAKLGFIYGSVSQIEINGQKVQLQGDKRENLSTLSFGASIGFLLK